MKRYNRKNTRDRRDLDAHLDNLGTTRSGRSGGRKRGSSGVRNPKNPRAQRNSRRRQRSNLGPVLLGLLAVVAVLGVVYLIVSSAFGGEEAAGQGDNAQIEVVQGDTLSSVADKLEENEVIGSSFMFTLQARMSGESAEIKPGRYTFARGEDGDSIRTKLTEGEAVPTFAFTLPEGLTLEQAADTVAESNGGITRQQFLEAARSTEYGYAFLDDPAIKNTEGFLFPKSYEFEEGTTADQVVNRLLEQYLLETENVDYAGASEDLNLTEYEILTVASLIEREAANDEERARIASVIYNRIRAGMPLQIDATIQYARGEQKENLSLQDLEIDSPYNTYQNPGLPPGPIASPSLKSIQAAVAPEETDLVYYVITPDGSEHFFTNNYDEFLQAKAEAGL
ncbi:endolytic transglycosylase MltG [Rubrobacter indicoceani]|uniref:endolytic transglycosylase MltG n=1 Tax=Rubrobacter indicoceani TaxID=2051957 RepID=UPI000E5B5568|nr:endolytic transglycosylase MltG [Rubrobacter indicoceani]